MRTTVHCACVLALAATSTGCGAGVVEVAGPGRAVGPGYVVSSPLRGESGPANKKGQAVKPKVTADFTGVPATNDWWSSLIWQFGDDPHSEAMYPHPLSARAEKRGLQIGYPDRPTIDGASYHFLHRADLVVGVDGLAAPDTRVAGFSDWTVTAAWDDGERSMRATLGHGMPFVYITRATARARVTVPSGAAAGVIVRRMGDAIVAVSVNGHHYGLFAPRGSRWQVDGDALVADLGDADFFSVAVLPDGSADTLALFARHAYAFVTGGRVDYRYHAATATVTTRFSVASELVEDGRGRSALPLVALYRHQWLRAGAETLPHRYVSPRGAMKLLAASEFSTRRTVSGLLPALPDTRGYDRGLLEGLVKLVANGDLFRPGLEGTRDSYWEAKSFGRAASLVRVADQLGATDLRDRLLDGIRAELEDWFDGAAPRLFYYDATWKTLIGMPTMYHSGTQLNDHHFHYGYFVNAAATVAQYDRAWAEAWAPFVEMLIRDAGNWRRDDDEFPYARHFDPYAGHSWASGTTFFPWGNNQESSSEEINFAAATALWGEVMDRPAIRDHGLALYVTAVDAVEQYWYDVDGEVYPEGYDHPAVGIVWGSGAVYDTWFSKLPAFIHGIQLTPLHAGALWLARRPDNIDRVIAHATAENRGPLLLWRDMYWMLLSMSDPTRPVAWLEDDHYFEPEWGNSMAYTYHFVHSMKNLGRFRPEVTADTAMFAVFDRGEARTYAAYNASATERTVRFSDGATLTVGPRQLASRTDNRNRKPTNEAPSRPAGDTP